MKKNIFIILFLLSSISFSQTIPYVILISFDGFRWDYLNRGITPNLDQIKNEGVNALSLRPSFPSKTFPNHYSIVTGMYPENHGIIANNFVNPFTNEVYKLGDTISVRDSKWYLGEAFWETAERNGIKTASYFWPGSEVKTDHRRPSIYEKYEHNRPYKSRIDGVVKWLKLPEKKRPHFISMYFHDTDSYGHKYGPNSPEINQSIQRLDSLIGYFKIELDKINFLDSVNILIVSDHGMTEINTNRIINIENILCGYNVKFGGEKPFMTIEPEKNEIDEVYELLKQNENHYKVYKKSELPERFHYSNHPFIYSLILIAENGWSLVNDSSFEKMNNSYSKGNHGYDNNHTDMHGIIIGKGPNLKSNFKTGTVWNIDIYPLLCKIFNISPRSNIDGKLERIEFLLK
ncbi:MAG: alkaline phosphatase family protein [Ignavibacteriales bacterium]|nr:alkaline phosphatase family protein [Ignavibacteriales bacterium]